MKIKSLILQSIHSGIEVFQKVKPLKGIESQFNVLVTGASGRLCQSLIPQLAEKNIRCVGAARRTPGVDQIKFTMQETEDEMKRVIEEHKFDAIINTAAASSGSWSELLTINAEAPVRMANAAKDCGIPFIQVSTTATQISGLTEAKPYALSKRTAEQELQNNKFAKIVRLDVLLGDDSKIDMAYLAAFSRFFPLGVQLSGVNSVIQPTTYDAASKAMSTYVKSVLSQEIQPKEINIVGHPIRISDFIRLVGKASYELHIPVSALEGLAQLVNEGALTPEFLRLAQISSENPIVFDTSDFERLHESPIPSMDEIAEKVHSTITLGSMLGMTKKIVTKVPLNQLFMETKGILQASNLRKL